MKALRWHGKQDLRYEDVPEPSPGPGQVKVKVRFTGICATDMHEYQNGPILISVPSLILGHEFSGDVVQVGEGVSKLKSGDRVGADGYWSCGKCFYCQRNMRNLCNQGAFTGVLGDCEGSMAEYIVVPEDTLYKLTDNISYEVGALIEPLAVGFHAVKQGKLMVGDTVAILGAGPIGICTLIAAKVAGASKIFVSEISKTRGEKALAMGATEIINPKEIDPVKKIHELTNGSGVDIAIDCIGLPFSGPQALDIVRKAGTAVIVGISSTPSEFTFMNIWATEKIIVGSQGYAREASFVVDLLSRNAIDTSGLITAKVALKDGVEKGFEELIRNPDKHVKILLES